MRRTMLPSGAGLVFACSSGHAQTVNIAGGHGFGMRKQGTSSDHWIDAFYYWVAAQGLTRPERRPDR